MPDYSGDSRSLTTILTWSDSKLVAELRNPLRARLGPEGYHLVIAVAVSRLLERKTRTKKKT
jgi:hypothetical protein